MTQPIITTPNCPRCSKPMRLRVNGRDKSQFWGCSQYPRCTSTLPLAARQVNMPSAIEFARNYVAPLNCKRIGDDRASVYQQNIFTALKTDTRNVIINAVAGSGKTSTLVEAIIRLYEGGYKGQILLLAFNTSIKDELAKRIKELGLDAFVTVRTTHGLGNSICAQMGLVFDENKLEAVLDRIGLAVPAKGQAERHEIARIRSERAEVAYALGLAKNTLTTVKSRFDIQNLAKNYGQNWATDAAKLAQYVSKAMELCQNSRTFDYNDMLWMPIVNNWAVPKYDMVMVDESQDLNAVQHPLVQRLCRLGARLVAVGDPYQAIYGFRGAVNNSMALLKQVVGNCVELALSVTYRCPRSHVAIAKQLVPHIQHAEHAAEGVIREEKFAKSCSGMTSDDMVICRRNAPLIQAAYALLKQGKRPIVRGREFGRNIITLVKKLKAETINDLMLKLAAYKVGEEDRLEGKAQAIQNLHDQCETVTVMCEGKTTVKEVLDFISELFDDEAKDGVVLSTVHRAKGLEAKTVYILDYERIQIPCKLEWQQDQERNLHYVAVTRSTELLILVEMPKEGNEDRSGARRARPEVHGTRRSGNGITVIDDATEVAEFEQAKAEVTSFLMKKDPDGLSLDVRDNLV